MKETVIKIIDFFSKNLKWILMAIIAILIFTTARSCSKYKSEKEENLHLENNLLALNDTLKNYKDGVYNLAEMRALQLRIDELADSLKLERNKKPVTIIKYITAVNDTFQVPVTIIHDTLWFDDDINISDAGIIYSHEHTLFEKSSREIDIRTPYYVNCDDGLLYADGESEVILNQNIWLENVLYKDKKGYTYIRLKTDYPGVTFNSGTAILVSDPKTDRKNQKQFGLGIGLQLGYGATYNNGFKMSPYIGIGIGLQWNPRFLQF